MLSCYGSELPQNHLDFWERTIKRITELINVDEIHLRFHPRTDESLHWPSKMSQTVAQFGCVRIADTNNVSLAETAADYIGVVGAVSGALRPARAVCSGFVIGLVDVSGDSWEEDWMLGKAEGIHWLHGGEEVGEKHLADFRLQVDRPTVPEIIRQLLPSF